MNMRNAFLRLVSHGVFVPIRFATGTHALPGLIAQSAPSFVAEVPAVAASAMLAT